MDTLYVPHVLCIQTKILWTQHRKCGALWKSGKVVLRGLGIKGRPKSVSITLSLCLLYTVKFGSTGVCTSEPPVSTKLSIESIPLASELGRRQQTRCVTALKKLHSSRSNRKPRSCEDHGPTGLGELSCCIHLRAGVGSEGSGVQSPKLSLSSVTE